VSAVFTERLAAADAQFLLLSHAVPNDQFLLYVFDGMPDLPSALARCRQNAEMCDDLRLSVCDDRSWRYPRWVRTGVDADQFVVHDAVGEWQHCLDSMVRLDHLDVSRMSWRMHVFPPNVVVVQISHALGDGTRSAALAATLFGRRTPLPAVRPDRGSLLLRGIAAARAHRGLVRDIEAGLVEPPSPPRPALSVNARSAGTPVLRSFVVDRTRLESPSVTVAALSSIGAALGGYLAARGEDVSGLAAEVPMAGAANVHVRNNFRNVTVGLYPELERGRRAVRIRAAALGDEALRSARRVGDGVRAHRRLQRQPRSGRSDVRGMPRGVHRRLPRVVTDDGPDPRRPRHRRHGGGQRAGRPDRGRRGRLPRPAGECTRSESRLNVDLGG
jgi:hypothetical protein